MFFTGSVLPKNKKKNVTFKLFFKQNWCTADIKYDLFTNYLIVAVNNICGVVVEIKVFFLPFFIEINN